MIENKDELILSILKSVSDVLCAHLGIEPPTATELRKFIDD